MSGTPATQHATDAAPIGPKEGARPFRRRRRIVFGILVVIVATAVGVGVAHPFGTSASSGTGTVDNAYPTSLATVAQGSLTSDTQVDATLGYAGSYDVVNQAQGTITSLPTIGQVVSRGQVLYQVNGSPVVLLYGSTPAYRTLSEGASATDVEGPDVQELNADLVALGYVSSAELSPTFYEFGYWTKVGVEDLQAALGLTVNGTLALGQAVFLPTAARITALGQTTILGGTAQPGSSILSATSAARVVTIDLDTAQQTEVAVGDRVAITLPNGQTTPGTVTSVGTVASTSSSGTTITVLVTPTDPASTGSWDQAPVEVTVTTGSVKNALVAPVDALLALASGGYALEVVSPKGVHSLEPVTLGLFDDSDGLVQVTGLASPSASASSCPTYEPHHRPTPRHRARLARDLGGRRG